MRRFTLTAWAAVTTAALLATGCSSGDDPASGRDVDSGSGLAASPTGKSRWAGRALQPFDDCDELTNWLSDQAADRVGAYGLTGYGGWGAFEEVGMAVSGDGDEMTADASAPAPSLPTTGSERVAGEDFSTTNTQEADVDEPDIVKTDGEVLVAAVDGTLRVVDVSGSEPALLGSVALEGGWNHELLLAGNRVFVLSHGDSSAIDTLTDSERESEPYGYYGYETTVLQEVDIANPERPTVEATKIIEGSYLTARVVDGVARVVVWSPPSQLDLVQPTGPGAEDIAEEANRSILEEAGVEQWIPNVLTVDGQGISDEEPLVDCGDVGHPEEFAGFGLLTVLSVDTGAALDTTDAVSIVADGQTVYASTDRLYVATNEWLDPLLMESGDAPSGDDYRTSIHAFDITEAGPAAYLASGAVEGQLLNQFAMSEHEGVLRVATTSAPWDGTSESMVTTLALEDQELTELGRVDGMGEGEQIYSVRFIGDVGYVVTFRQTDPLYVLDLSDPADPQVTGELKIPGYSAYLHPVGDGLLMGVGQDATDEGTTLGVQVSLFDVSDPGNPERVSQLTFGSGSSDVEYDHRAFTWWAPDGLAIVPMQSYDEGAQVTGAVGIEVDGTELVERGRLARTDTETCATPIDDVGFDRQDGVAVPPPLPPEECFSFPAPLTRAVVIGDQVLTISSGGLGVHALDTLAGTGFVDWS